MFNKLKFNNLVISNKKGIQQSRIQTINKLVHKVRKLKTLLEKHPENMKCKERIRKSTETMEILKKLKIMDIMKKILLMEKPAPAIITNGLAIPEEIAIALLSMNKVMQVMVKRFKTELEVNETKTEDWKQVLMESSKRKKKRECTEEKRKKRLEAKQHKAVGRKRQEWLDDNQINVKDDLKLDADVNISATGNWNIDDLPGDNKVIKKSIKTSKEESKKNVQKKKENIETIVEYKCAESYSLEEKDGSNIPDTNQSEKSFDNEEESKDSLEIDTFFITDTGENYLSTAISQKKRIGEEEIIEKRDLHMIKLNDLDKKHFEFDNRQNQRGQKNGNKWKSERDQQNKINRNENFSRNQQMDTSFQKRKQDFNNMHPSWAAKHKLKPVISEFQGRKITFEDDFLSQKNSRSQNDITNKKCKSMEVNNTEKDQLHPSWVAKQKLKPSITAFQGRKTIFNNDE